MCTGKQTCPAEQQEGAPCLALRMHKHQEVGRIIASCHRNRASSPNCLKRLSTRRTKCDEPAQTARKEVEIDECQHKTNDEAHGMVLIVRHIINKIKS